jgi:hypothetical protein
MGFLGVAGSDMVKALLFGFAGGSFPRSRNQYSPGKTGVKKVDVDLDNFYM